MSLDSYCQDGYELKILPNLLPPDEIVFNSKEFVCSNRELICQLNCQPKKIKPCK